ncbi:MAG: zinc ribbon domain-containing protein [Phormidesmis sp.]
MPTCPRCDRSITHTAITCPHCNITLKAHGHPGMPLHRATDKTPLCATCAYDADNSCTFPKRPNALTCTLYQDSHSAPETASTPLYRIPWWRKRNARVWIAALALIAVSLIAALL